MPCRQSPGSPYIPHLVQAWPCYQQAWNPIPNSCTTGELKFIILNFKDHYFFGWGMQNIEKNCLQKQENPNKLFAHRKIANRKMQLEKIDCIDNDTHKKIVCIFKKISSPLPLRKIMVHPLTSVLCGQITCFFSWQYMWPRVLTF